MATTTAMASDDDETRGETWESWQAPDAGPPQLVTRAQLLALGERLYLAEKPNPLTLRNLRYWEHEGVLPRPVRRWEGGATRAWYPLWMLHLVFELRRLRGQGYGLDDIAPRLRALAWNLSRTLRPGDTLHPRELVPEWEREPSFTPRQEADVRAMLEYLALVYVGFTGTTIRRAEIVFIDEAGRRIVRPYPLFEGRPAPTWPPHGDGEQAGS